LTGSLYGIFLPMLEGIRDPSATIDERFTAALSGSAGFAAFVGGERAVTWILGGSRLKFPAHAGGAAVGVLASHLVGYGVGWLLQTEWAQENLSWTTKKAVVETISFSADRLNGFATGKMMEALGARLVTSLETGPFALLAMVTGAAGDLAISTGYQFIDGGVFEQEANRMVAAWLDHSYSTSPWYRLDLHLLSGVVRPFNRAFLGSEGMAILDAEGIAGRGGAKELKTYLVNQKCEQFWVMINQYYTALFLEHGKIGQDGKYEIDLAKVNEVVRKQPEILWMLGFIKQFRPQDFRFISFSDFSLNQAGATAYLQYLRTEANPPLPLSNGGTITLNEHLSSREEGTTARAARLLEIRIAQRMGTYKLEEVDLAAGLVDSAGNILEQDQETTALSEHFEKTLFQTNINNFYREAFVWPGEVPDPDQAIYQGDSRALGDTYAFVTTLAELEKAFPELYQVWLDQQPPIIKQYLANCAKHAGQVEKLRGKIPDLTAELNKHLSALRDGLTETSASARLEDLNWTEDHTLQIMHCAGELYKAYEELVIYYIYAGYDLEKVLELRQAMQELEPLLAKEYKPKEGSVSRELRKEVFSVTWRMAQKDPAYIQELYLQAISLNSLGIKDLHYRGGYGVISGNTLPCHYTDWVRIPDLIEAIERGETYKPTQLYEYR
jgi:hypothetical protein